MTAKILHILTALSLLFSTTGLKVSFHYCEDTFSGLAVFKEASSCHSDADTCHVAKSCCKSSTDKKDCCKTDTEVFQLDIEKINTSIELHDVNVPMAMVVKPHSYTNWTHLKTSSKFQYYRPPPLIKDIPVLFESFRC